LRAKEITETIKFELEIDMPEVFHVLAWLREKELDQMHKDKNEKKKCEVNLLGNNGLNASWKRDQGVR